MTTQVAIDPNVRVAGNETFSGFEDIRGPRPAEGDRVIVTVEETDVVGFATVTRVDDSDQLIYLAVNWSELAPAERLSPGDLVERVQSGIVEPISPLASLTPGAA
ncbi:hypothetical protein ACWDTI_09430 [Gordonia sp. NPDC003424]